MKYVNPSYLHQNVYIIYDYSNSPSSVCT